MRIKIQKIDTIERLDTFLAKKLQLSRAFVQKQIKNESVLVNKKTTNSSHKLSIGDIIEIVKTEQDVPRIIPNKNIKFKVVDETENYIVIEKPEKLIMHPAKGIEEPTLSDALVAKYSEISSVGDDKLRPGIVHRLDKGVSGLVVIARNKKMFDFLKEQFGSRKINKEYIALVHGEIEKDERTIDVPIGRSKTKGRKMAAHIHEFTGDKKAKTEFSVLQRFRNFTLIKVKILTGRTHQIRVHLNSIGHPVVGDELYKNRKLKKTDLGRLFLHASALSFEDLDGTKKTYVSSLPKELNDFLDKESTKRKNSLKLKSKKI